MTNFSPEVREIIADASSAAEQADLTEATEEHSQRVADLEEEHAATTAELHQRIEQLEAENIELARSLAALPEFVRLEAVVRAEIPRDKQLEVAKQLTATTLEECIDQAHRYKSVFFTSTAPQPAPTRVAATDPGRGIITRRRWA